MRAPWAVPVAAVVAGLAGGIGGYVVGLEDDDDGSGGSRCPIVQVPVSDHVEGQCIPEASPLFELFDTQSTPPGATADGWVAVGELWLQREGPGGGDRLCWLNSTEETLCSG